MHHGYSHIGYTFTRSLRLSFSVHKLTWKFSLHVATFTSVPQITSFWPRDCSLGTMSSAAAYWESEDRNMLMGWPTLCSQGNTIRDLLCTHAIRLQIHLQTLSCWAQIWPLPYRCASHPTSWGSFHSRAGSAICQWWTNIKVQRNSWRMNLRKAGKQGILCSWVLQVLSWWGGHWRHLSRGRIFASMSPFGRWSIFFNMALMYS